MSQHGFYFDQSRCFNCKACVFACKSWNDDKRGDITVNPSLSWLPDIDKTEVTKYANPAEYELGSPQGEGQINYAEYRKYHMKENWRRVGTTEFGDVPPNVDALHISISCNHCEDPACVKVCPMGNIVKEQKFGAVLVGKTCISCGKCNSACPWDAPQYYDPNYATYAQSDPKRPRMTKCIMCYDRINEGLRPACVTACLGRALEFGPLDELKQKHQGYETAAAGFAEDRIDALGSNTKPSVIFKTRPLNVK